MRYVYLCLLACLCFTRQVLARDAKTLDAKKSNVDEKTIRALIVQLGDESFKKREEAQTRLIALGRQAAALLMKAATEV
jgi:hypothetical protein